jgi:hypothetical protein
MRADSTLIPSTSSAIVSSAFGFFADLAYRFRARRVREMVLVQISRKLDPRIRLPSEKWHHSPAKLGINLNLHQNPALSWCPRAPIAFC